MELQLQELLHIPLCPIRFYGNEKILNQPISGLCTDSRVIRPGEIFIALKGEKFDGHQFVPELQARGVKIFIVAKDWFESRDQKWLNSDYFVAQNTLVALQEISHYYRLKFDIPVLALTGSNGKTTTKEMIAAVLGEKYHVLKNKGNLNNHIGVPVSLLELTRDHQLAIIEMGTNHFGEITRLAEIAYPTGGLITNIGPAHLEFFGSIAGVFKAKSELWHFLEKYGQMAFINVDDPWLRKYQPSVNEVIRYGFEHPAQIQGEFMGVDDQGRATFKVAGTEINLAIPGVHNIYNALAAVAVGLKFNLQLSTMKAALEEFLPTAKRMEVIRTHGFVIINDCYNSNPDSAKKALLTLSQMKTSGKRIAVLADMLELGEWSEAEHRTVGDFIVELNNIDYLLTYGQLSQLSARQAEKSGMKQVFHFDSKQELVNHLKKIVNQGDLILIKGSRGMEMEEITMGIRGNEKDQKI